MDKSEVTTQLQLSTPFLVTEGTRSAARSRLANHARAQLDTAESRRVVRLPRAGRFVIIRLLLPSCRLLKPNAGGRKAGS